MGFIALCHSKGTDFAAFFGGQTTQKPKLYNTDAYAASEDVEGFKKAVTEGIMAQQEIINIEAYNMTEANIYTHFYDVYYDNPYLFGAEWTHYTPANGMVVAMRFNYRYTKEQNSIFYTKFNKEVNTIVAAAKSMTPLEKILYVHEYFVSNYSYDYDSYLLHRDYNDTLAIPDEHYTAIGVMVNKTGVCQGYALAFNHVMKKLGIESHMVTSDSMNHAWNVVKLNGYYYHIDSTWDDPVYDTAGKVEHTYFLVSDSKLKSLGYSGYNSSLYPAKSTKYDNMFWRDVKSAFTYYKGYWYYINSSGVIYKYDVKNNTKSKVMDLPDKKWNLVGNNSSHYKGIYSTFRVHNGNIYFNTKKYIYKLNVSTKKASIAVSPSTKKGYIYGLGYINGKVVYQLKTKPSEKGSLYSCGQAVVVSAANYFAANDVCEARDLSKCKISIASAIYTGKAQSPKVTIVYGNYTLKKNTDYKLSYTNNVNLGKGYVTIEGIGNYKGTKKLAFNITLDTVKNVKTSARNKSSIKITWSKVVGATSYYVYRYDSKNGKYVNIGKTSGNSFLNKGLARITKYYYKVVAKRGSSKGGASAKHTTYTSK